ncbi:MFS transporter [Caldimonas sp. KR1-144]|uniref:MFS transporter n=1 Tax=Caldimonas sp. KR1-144 TaxID=3400911 RepID=UPI003C0C818A
MEPPPAAADALNPRDAARGVVRVGAAVTLVVLMFSLLNPVLAVRLQSAGHGASAIGLFLMLPFAAIALAVPMLPRVFARLGVPPALRWGLLLEFSATLTYGLVDDYGAWCAAAAISGLGAAAAWNGTEALVAQHAPREARGRWTGLYQTALGVALALGPFLPGLLALTPLSATWIACGGLALALLLLMSPRVSRLGGALSGHRAGWWRAACERPLLVWAAFVGGVFEAGLASITAAYGFELGFTLAASTSIAGVLGIGSFALQYPTGWLADRHGTRALLIAAGVLLALASLPLARAADAPAWLWPAALLWGAVGGALYTLTMIRVAHEWSDAVGPGNVVAGTAAVITGYTAGGALGPLVSGVLIERLGVVAQSAWLVLLASSIVFGSWRSSR